MKNKILVEYANTSLSVW